MKFKKIAAVLLAAATATACATSFAACGKDEDKIYSTVNIAKRMENLDRGLVAVNNNWGNTFLSWRLLGDESLENQAFDIYRNGVKIHTTGPHDPTQWNDYDNPPLDAYYQVVPAGESVANAKTVKTVNTSKGAAGYVDIKFDMPADDIQKTSKQTYKLDDKGEKIPVMVTDPDTGKESQLEVEDPVTHQMVKQYEMVSAVDENGDIILTDRLDDKGNKIIWKYGVDDITCGDLDGDGEYELVVMFYGSTQHSWPGYSSPVIIRGIDVDWSTGENKTLWEINCGRNICAGTHYNPILVEDFDGDGKAEMFMKTAPGVYTVDGSKPNGKYYVSEAGKGKYSQFNWDYDTHTGTRTLYDVKNIDNNRYYGNPDFGCWSGPELLTVFNGETGKAMQTIGYEADWNIPPKWTGGRDEGKPRWGDYVGNRSERFLATAAYLDGEHPSAVMTRGLYSYVYLTAYDWDGENIKQLWLSENNWVGGDDGASDVREGVAIGNNVVWYGDDRYNYTESRPHATGVLTAHGQGNHSLGAADYDNDGKHEIVYGAAVIDDNGLVLATTYRGHGDAHHINDFNNDGRTEVFTVHEQGPGIDLIQYDEKSDRGYKDLYWSGDAGWDIGRGMAGNLDDNYALKYNDPAVFYSIMNGSLYSAKTGKELQGYKSKASGLPAALAPNSNGKGCMDFSVYWDGDLGVELLDIAGTTSGAPFLANHYIDYVEKGAWDDVLGAGLKGQTNRIAFSNHLETVLPDVGTNNGTKGVPALTADILGDWREEMLFRLNDLDGNGYCDGIRMYTSCDLTKYRLYTLMHDSQYRCQVSSENVGYNQPPHTSYYIGSLALAKDSEGQLLNYLAPQKPFDEVYYK